MVNFGPLAAEIVSLVWGTPGNFNGFRVLACSVTARHSTSGRQPNCGVEQTALPVFGRAAITLGIGPTFLVDAVYMMKSTDELELSSFRHGGVKMTGLSLISGDATDSYLRRVATATTSFNEHRPHPTTSRHLRPLLTVCIQHITDRSSVRWWGMGAVV